VPNRSPRADVGGLLARVLSLAWKQLLEGADTAGRHQTSEQRKTQAAVEEGRSAYWRRRMRMELEVTRPLGARARKIPPGRKAVKTMDPRVNSE
jgi:glucose-6-phosphate isomerase